MQQLDITKFSEDTKSLPIGRLSQNMIDFLLQKKPDFSGRLSSDTDILFWSGRVKHAEKHKADFSSDSEFYQCLADIPSIIQNPDYISIHPTDESISFIKDYSGHTSVAIKVSMDGKLVFRTLYPLHDSQLQSYIQNGRAWPIPKEC